MFLTILRLLPTKKVILLNIIPLFLLDSYDGPYVDNEFMKAGQRAPLIGKSAKIVVTYKNKVCHSINDAPAIIFYNDTIEGVIDIMCWCNEGMFHREGDQPASIDAYGKFYIKNNIIDKVIVKKNNKNLFDITDQYID